MKKIVLMVVAMFAMTTMSFAENENNNAMANAEAYDMTVNIRKLAVTLGLTNDQMEVVQDIHSAFCDEMMLAAYAKDEDRADMVDKAVKKDLLKKNTASRRKAQLHAFAKKAGVKLA